MYDIDKLVKHDEFGESIVIDEAYTHIGDIIIQSVEFESLDYDYMPLYGSGIDTVNGLYVIDLPVDELYEI